MSARNKFPGGLKIVQETSHDERDAEPSTFHIVDYQNLTYPTLGTRTHLKVNI